MRVALVPLATEAGNLEGNARAIVAGIGAARERGAEVALFPELALPGYPPLDLLLEPSFVPENLRLLREVVAPAARRVAALVGFVEPDPARTTPEDRPVLRRRGAGRWRPRGRSDAQDPAAELRVPRAALFRARL